MYRLSPWLLGAVALCLLGCSQELGVSEPVMREFQPFQREVYPVLLRDCGFTTCHGDSNRFFRVWGPGRSRLEGEEGLPEAFDLPTGDEIATSYSLALSMLDDEEPGRSRLLLKPLAIEAGGVGHQGADKFGRDVYRTEGDSGYVTLARWAFSRMEMQMEAAP